MFLCKSRFWAQVNSRIKIYLSDYWNKQTMEKIWYFHRSRYRNERFLFNWILANVIQLMRTKTIYVEQSSREGVINCPFRYNFRTSIVEFFFFDLLISFWFSFSLVVSLIAIHKQFNSPFFEGMNHFLEQIPFFLININFIWYGLFINWSRLMQEKESTSKFTGIRMNYHHNDEAWCRIIHNLEQTFCFKFVVT